MAQNDDSKLSADQQHGLSRTAKIAISVLVFGHLAAVALPPLSFQASGPLGNSPSVRGLLTPFQGYGEFLYLDRGYAFFAPDPVPSHLIEGVVVDENGQQLSQHKFPDLEKHWPRLLYHRHFMLAEFLNDSYIQPSPPPNLPPENTAEFIRVRQRYVGLRKSIIDHLQHVHDGKTVQIRRLEHLIPDHLEFLGGVTLDNPDLMLQLLDTPTVVAEDIPAPAAATPDLELTAPKQSNPVSESGDPPKQESSSQEGQITEFTP